MYIEAFTTQLPTINYATTNRDIGRNFDVDASMRKYVSIWEEEIRVRRLG